MFDATKTDDAVSFDEQRHYADQRVDAARVQKRNTFPKLDDGLGAMVPHYSRCGLFPHSPPKATDAKMIDGNFDVARYDSEDAVKGSIHYTGPRLSQFHKRVLIGLMSLVAGKQGDTWVDFHAVQFLESIGKEGDSRTIAKLLDALTDLRSATLRVRLYASQRVEVFGWVMRAEFSTGSREVRVLIDGKGSRQFAELGCTYLPMPERNRLADGLQTWLFDFLYSSQQTRFSYDALAAVLGRTPGADFGKDVRAALEKLKEVGAIAPPEYSRGRFTAIKKPVR